MILSIFSCVYLPSVSVKEISPEYSLEGLMLKMKLQYFDHLMWRTDSLEKTDAGKDWGQEEKGMTEDDMVRWHHWLDGHEFEQAPGVGDGQGGLMCCSLWGHKELDTTEQLNWTDLCFGEGAIPIFCPFFNWIVCFLNASWESFVILDKNCFSDKWFVNIFS